MKTVRQVMSKGFLSVPPDLCITTLAQLFERHAITGAPVIDDEGQMVGVVSQADLTRARVLAAEVHREPGEPELAELLVADLMSHRVHSIEDEATVAQAARAMLELDVRRLVVRSDQAFVGIVTAGDLMRAWLPEDGPVNLMTMLRGKEELDARAA